MKKVVIIVAGGKGNRMESNIPKQFLNIAGRPVLFYTIECFFRYSPDIEIVVVLPELYLDDWRSLIKKYEFTIHHKLVVGGETRFQSVKKGLNLISGSALVAIHDGVRPFVSQDTLKRVFTMAEKTGNAIPVVSVTESIRRLINDTSEPVIRENYRMVQTPQCFHSELLKKAYEQAYREQFTDDASVVEAMGIKINLVEGNPENIKITRPGDLKFAEAFLK